MRQLIRNVVDGLFISLQFFTVVPLRKQLTLTPSRVRKALQLYPLIGLLLGCVLATLAFYTNLLELPDTMIALLIMTVAIGFTGGLHIDGWMDTSDAFFSYRDRDKRLEIMDDPHIGAFGVMSLLFLLGWRYVFILEMIQDVSLLTLMLIASLYFCNRLAMVYIFLFAKPAKSEGIAAFFKQSLQKRDLYFQLGSLFLIGGLIALIHVQALIYVGILLLATIGLALYCKRFIIKQFGGITGDTLGAVLEGVETSLWLVLWLLHSFATGQL